jgi:hypothetical protein
LDNEREKIIASTAEIHSAELEGVRAELGKAKARIEILEPLETRVGELEGLVSSGESEKARVETLEKELEEERTKRQEGEKEHEDLLVLLDELSSKRRKDKARMKEKDMEVSEGEEDDEPEEE